MWNQRTFRKKFELRKYVKKPGTLAHTRLGNVGCGQYTLLLNRIFYSIWRILQHTKFYPNLNMHEKR